ncbi:hypothetical protein ACWDOR_43475, partial [Streptosporangium canum]
QSQQRPVTIKYTTGVSFHLPIGGHGSNDVDTGQDMLGEAGSGHDEAGEDAADLSEGWPDRLAGAQLGLSW